MSYLLGIDLGATSVTAAVLADRDGGVHALPAVLVATPAGDLVCGEPARRRATADPDRVARDFLERVGDPTPLSLGGVPYRAEDLCARLVRFLVDEVAGRRGGPPSRIGVTHPVSWGRHKCDLLAGALSRHGLTVSLVAAPQAVALAHRGGAPAGRPLAVVDLGGTGATATVLQPAAAGMLPTVAGRSAGCRAGGADVDDAVFAFVRRATPELAAAFDGLDTDDPRVLAGLTALRDDCRAAKELLSRDTVATVHVELPGARASVRVHRSDLDELAGPLLEPVADPVEQVLAGVPDAEVLLAGGAGRMPVAVQVLSAALGRPVAVAADPVHGAARGAAMAVSPGAGTSWPGTRIAPVTGNDPSAGPDPAGAARIPAPREADRLTAAGAPVRVPAQRGAERIGAPRARRVPETALRAPAWSARDRAERDATPGTAVVGLLDPATGPVPAVPAQREAVDTGRVGRHAAVPAPAARGGTAAAAPASPAPPAPAAPCPERPTPDTLVTRDAGPGAVTRSQVRQRLLLGAGGLAGAAVVAAAVLFWPSQPSIGELSAAPTLPASSVPAPAPVVPGAAAPDAVVPAPPGTVAPDSGAATVAARAGSDAPAAAGREPASAGSAAAPAGPGAPAPAVPAAPPVPPAPPPQAPVTTPAQPTQPAQPAPTTPPQPTTPPVSSPVEGTHDTAPTDPPPATGGATPGPSATTTPSPTTTGATA